MAIDSPARIVIIGAGPIGLESALYGRFLGYDVVVYEAETVGHNMASCASESLGLCKDSTSPLAWAALSAQDSESSTPAADDALVGKDYLERYALPIATTDLLNGRVETGCAVSNVAWTDEANPEREGYDDELVLGHFQVSLKRESGTVETSETVADVVIDASGVAGPDYKRTGIQYESDAEAVPQGVTPWDSCEDKLAHKIVLPTPRYFVIGRRSFGRREDFSLSAGLEQVKQLFSHLGDRESLDLNQQFRG